MEIHALAAETKRSYVHGCSTSSLLFDTIGHRIRMAAKKVKSVKSYTNYELQNCFSSQTESS